MSTCFRSFGFYLLFCGFVLPCFVLLVLSESSVESIGELNDFGQWKMQGIAKVSHPSAQRSHYLPHNLQLWKFHRDREVRQPLKLESPPFILSDRLAFFVSGQPNHPTTDFWLTSQDGDSRRLKMQINPLESWLLFDFSVPLAWQGKEVVLEIHSESKRDLTPLGLSIPFISTPFVSKVLHAPKFNDLSTLAATKVLREISIYTLQFIFMLFPGVLLALLLSDILSLPPSSKVIMAILVSCCYGYLTFWIYFFLSTKASYFVGTLYVLACCLPLARMQDRYLISRALNDAQLILPLLLMYFSGLFYLSILQWTDINPATLIKSRFSHMLPIDNDLPGAFAHALAGLSPLLPEKGVHYGERPPLQAGMILFTPAIFIDTFNHFRVHALGIVLQMAWVPALFFLVRQLVVSKFVFVCVFVCCLFSGFFLLNSLYVWPKLLSGSLSILCFSLILCAHEKTFVHTYVFNLLIALSGALAVLAHTGSVFFLLPTFLLMAWPTFFPGWKKVVMGVVVFISLNGAWYAYQQFFDPPSNLLARIHIADDSALGDRSLSESLVKLSHRLTLDKWLSYKASAWEGLGLKQSVVLSFQRLVMLGPMSIKDSLSAYRKASFGQTFTALGVLPIAMLSSLLLLPWLWGSKKSAMLKKAGSLLMFCGVCLAVWFFVVLKRHTLHINSYATMILLFTAGGIFLSCLPRWLRILLLLGQMLIFIVYFLVSYVPYQGAPLFISWQSINGMALSVTLLSVIILFYLLYLIAYRPVTQRV